MTLLNCNSIELVLEHPTLEEAITISTRTWEAWGDSLPLNLYLKESQFLTTVPLARDGGLTQWILVDKRLPAGRRPILSSCETVRKRALTTIANGHIEEGIVHGIASVFTFSEFRGRGYAARMMRELAQALRTWQTGSTGRRCFGSILYSDIGKTYYANLGWKPNPTNSHVELQALPHPKYPCVREIFLTDLPSLCERDESMIETTLAGLADETQPRVTIVPDLDHMLWHIGKEEFACQYLFGSVPRAKGAIAGDSGNQVWATWTHRYYTHPQAKGANTVLYILRLVVEQDKTATRLPFDPNEQLGKHLTIEQYAEQVIYLKAILQAAQSEAAEWGIGVVKLWEPTPLVMEMLERSGITYSVVDREEDSIASSRWYGEKEDDTTILHWMNNEHYSWL